jgi:hypothetical protein
LLVLLAPEKFVLQSIGYGNFNNRFYGIAHLNTSHVLVDTNVKKILIEIFQGTD